MTSLVEDIASLENEADSILARARADAKEIEKSAIAEAEVYRQKLAEETEQKIMAFRREMEEKHKKTIAEAQKELTQTLDAMDQIAGDSLEKQVQRIVTRFSDS